MATSVEVLKWQVLLYLDYVYYKTHEVYRVFYIKKHVTDMCESSITTMERTLGQ